MVFPTRFNPDTSTSTLITADAGSSYRVGPYRVQNVLGFAPGAPTSLADVESALGHDDRCTGDQSEATVAWPARGVTGEFTTLSAFADPSGHPVTTPASPCQYRDQIQVDRLTASAAHWHTRRGLKIGDSIGRLQQLYPAAAEHDDGWWLHTVQLPWGGGEEQGDLLATVRNGKVSALTAVLAAEGD